MIAGLNSRSTTIKSPEAVYTNPNLMRLPTPVISPHMDVENMSLEAPSTVSRRVEQYKMNGICFRHDRDLRSIARKGVHMAFSGYFDENDIRD